jgi:hypothetical protein
MFVIGKFTQGMGIPQDMGILPGIPQDIGIPPGIPMNAFFSSRCLA